MAMIGRRRIVTGLAAAAAAGLIGTPQGAATEPPLETTTLRLGRIPASCDAPIYSADELLRAEGFTDVRFVSTTPGRARIEALGRGEFDFTMSFAVTQITALDAGIPISIVAGLHAGCYELFARDAVRGITDLKGKRVGLLQSPPAFLIMMAASVGLDRKDIDWVTDPALRPLDLFADGGLDAFLAFPPEPQELRARHAGHVIVNTALDRPWSHYFCCMLVGNREFVSKNPVATKRAARAILKATDLCDSEPERAAQAIVGRGFADRYDFLRQTLNDYPYKWREYDAEDTVRFYALRLQEVGLIKSSPQKIIADGTDWRFLNELKRELKG
ncbi:ABC transporter substrate-binding protein [Bradyrhizobium sp.]|uniref:ABC transporter substrate-binding protein n=1 Tax=Bradyrhizobium sp. TaxID=376 RepID=UPI002C967A7D|nr:ABC transporter substrate-binding protein [Bradyrhizobium sp.]HWX62854.1 ABC transporter substrate-binding protein [Bradyrhizobium sp.]